jgi:ketosteroid isomerase-like protein
MTRHRWGSAGATIDSVPTLAEDVEEIRRLLARFCFAIDSQDADTWADLFSEDEVFHYALGEPLVGPDALRQFGSMVPGDRHHLTMNEIIEVDGDRASVRANAHIEIAPTEGRPSPRKGGLVFDVAIVEGGSRLSAGAVGIEQVLVDGQVIAEHGDLTDALPGTVLRSGRDTETVVV